MQIEKILTEIKKAQYYFQRIEEVDESYDRKIYDLVSLGASTLKPLIEELELEVKKNAVNKDEEDKYLETHGR